MYWKLLQAQLTTTVTSDYFLMDVDPTGLVVGGSTTARGHQLAVEYERPPPNGFRTAIWYGWLAGDATVRWISSIGSVDVFEFTGPVLVVAHRVNGRRSQKGNRAMACAGTDKVTVRVDWSQPGS